MLIHVRNILLNYAVAHPVYGYTQGMSDLLAPVLAEIQNEVDAYWCFVGLMQKTSFFSSPTDVDMDCQLVGRSGSPSASFSVVFLLDFISSWCSFFVLLLLMLLILHLFLIDG